MILGLLLDGQYQLFVLIITTLTISLSFHEYGHAIVARFFGDRTAEQQGRLTLNPLVHIHPIGLLMVMTIGIGFAKPVPINPSYFTHPKADLFVAAAGPLMNFILAVIMVNLYVYGSLNQWPGFISPLAQKFFILFSQINLLLMVFNLLPIGPLDGHYILPHCLPKKLAHFYRYYNHRYGLWVLAALILMTILGLPILTHVVYFATDTLIKWIVLT